MNIDRNPVRRLTAVMALAAVLVTSSGVLAHASALEGDGGTPGLPFSADGLWSAATCGFAFALAKLDPGFFDSAVMICLKAVTLDQ